MSLSKRFKEHQQKTAIVAFGILLLLVVLIAVFNTDSKPVVTQSLHDKSPVYDVTKIVEDKNVWMFQSENRLAEQEKTQSLILKELEDIKQTLAKEREVNQAIFNERIENTLEQTQELMPIDDEEDPAEYFGRSTSHPSEQIDYPIKRIFSQRLPLSASHHQKSTPHIDSYIPAGSYAKAVLLSGVDVSAGVSSQASPKPVLLRLMHPGSLPNKAVGKMKDCRIIAAAYGDLSSERAYMRLEKLSCTEPDGHVIETNVDGYISGEDGKNGIRGRVVMRDMDVLQRGFIGGLLSGLGKVASESLAASKMSPFGRMNQSQDKLGIFKQAGAEGTSDAFELMAKYHIQRAEQYQPVIQISAGRIVEVVFHSGSQFGEQQPRIAPQQSPFFISNPNPDGG